MLELERLLELFPDLEELFEQLDITPLQVLEVLYQGGHISLPTYLEESLG